VGTIKQNPEPIIVEIIQLILSFLVVIQGPISDLGYQVQRGVAQMKYTNSSQTELTIIQYFCAKQASERLMSEKIVTWTLRACGRPAPAISKDGNPRV
jgi:hypothetical protein